ncbi:MAG TPA: molybdopterin-dependent oxidoreductase, partial [Burkholderiales bacterium]|nr:molybdopterin-dependent oxidoreductase [Burkholderiales bacterium]
MEPAPSNTKALSLKVVKATCPHDCPDACAMLVTVDVKSGRAVRIEGDPTHPVTRGYLCNKVNHYLDLVYSDKRVLYPHRRIGPKGPGAQWQRISWDEALDDVSARLKTVIAEHGAEAVLPYSYSGSIAILGFLGMGERFFNKMGACRLERTICTAAGVAAESFTDGRVGQANIEDLPGMEVIILWGTNLVSTGVHAMPFVNEARANGARIIA